MEAGPEDRFKGTILIIYNVQTLTLYHRRVEARPENMFKGTLSHISLSLQDLKPPLKPVADSGKYYRHHAKLLQFANFKFFPLFLLVRLIKKLSAGQINPDSNRFKTVLLLNCEWCTQAVVEAKYGQSSIVVEFVCIAQVVLRYSDSCIKGSLTRDF
jgi:hypothetical protein